MNRIVAYVNVLKAQINVCALIRLGTQLRTHPFPTHVAGLTSILMGLFAYPALGTSVIALQMHGRVILGADAKIGIVNSRGQSDVRCKIEQLSPNQFIGASGVLTYGKRDIFSIAHTSASFTVEETAGAFERVITSVILGAAKNEVQLPMAQSQLRREYINGKLPWLSVAFVSFTGKHTVMVFREFRVLENKGIVSVIPRRQTCPGAGCRNAMTLWRLGFTDAPATFDEADSIIEHSQSLPGGVTTLINMEIAKHPDKIGPPIDILVVEPTRAYWDPDHHQGCPAIQ